MCICRACRDTCPRPSPCCSCSAFSGSAPPLPRRCAAFVVGVAGGFARLAADLVMRNDGATVTTSKQQLYHHAITLEQYNAAIAPIRSAAWLDLRFLEYPLALLHADSAAGDGSADDRDQLAHRSRRVPACVKFTWYGATPQEKAATRASWNGRDVALSLVVLAAVVAVLHRVLVSATPIRVGTDVSSRIEWRNKV